MPSKSSSDHRSFNTPGSGSRSKSSSGSYHTPRGTPIPVAPRRTRLTKQMILDAFNDKSDRPWQTPDTKWMLGKKNATFIVNFMHKNPELGGAGWSLHFGKIPWPPSRGRTLENHDFSSVLNALRQHLEPEVTGDLVKERMFGKKQWHTDKKNKKGERFDPEEDLARMLRAELSKKKKRKKKKKKRKKTKGKPKKKTKGKTKKKRRHS
jgi:hypothetical protein